jgi:hypothetical protein
MLSFIMVMLQGNFRWQERVTLKLKGVITFSPHELPVNVILPPRTTTSTKREHQTTIFIHFAPFRQEFR